MPLRPSLLSNDALEVGADLDLRSQLESAISSIRMPTMLDEGISQIKSMAMQFDAPEPMKVPDLRETMPGYGVEPEQMQASAAPAAFSGRPQAMPSAAGTGTASFQGGKNPEGQARVYQRALASGLDDEGARVLAAVTETEGGWGGAVGDQGQSRGIYQFHERGEMPAFRAWLQRQGIQGDANTLAYDPDIATRYAAEGYLGAAIKAGRAQGLTGSALATFVQRTGQRSVDPEATGRNYERLYGGQQQQPAAQTGAPQGQPQAAPAGGAPQWGTYTPETLTPNQFNEGREQGLTPAEAIAICGPAAAVAFARVSGRQPTLREAKELAQSLNLWDEGAGMYGPSAQVALMERMGVKSELRQGADWANIAREVQAGRPVIVDTPQHYYTVTGYDARTGEFEFGQSAGVLTASRGKTRWRPEELPSLGMGSPRATIFLAAQGAR